MFTTKVGCPACAKTIERDATTCPHCGHRLAAEAPASTAPEATGRRPQEFELTDVPSAGLLRRLSGRVPREHVFVELRNLLATTSFHDVRESDVASILAKGRLLPREVNDQLTAIYGRITGQVDVSPGVLLDLQPVLVKREVGDLREGHRRVLALTLQEHPHSEELQDMRQRSPSKGDSYRLREKLKAGLLKSKTVLEGPATSD